MNNCQNSLVHPKILLKSEWIVARRSLQGEGLIVNHCIEPPGVDEPPPLSHHVLVMQLSKGTRQITRFNGQEHDGKFNPGEFFLVPASLSGFTSWETTDEALTFFIEPSFLSKVAKETESIDADKVEVRDLVKSYDPQLESIAYAFLKEMRTGGIGSQIYTDSLANMLAVSLLRNQCVFQANVREYLGGLSPANKAKAIDYIQAHLDRDLGLTEVSQLVGLSQYHFVRQFKKSVGITPHQYVMQQRVEMAKRMLKRQDIPLSDVAFDCGFSNQSHLGRVFKRYTGTTPKRYQQEFD